MNTVLMLLKMKMSGIMKTELENHKRKNILQEMPKYTYTIEEVMQNTKNHSINYNLDIYEVYYAYIGRRDQPGVYDKRPCIIYRDLGEEVQVFKITSKGKDNPYRYKILDCVNAGLKDPSYISLDNNMYAINKAWITPYVGCLSNEDVSRVSDLLSHKYGNRE